MSDALLKHGKFLAALMGHSINGTTLAEIPEDINWERLYKLSVFHNVSALIYPVVSGLDIPKDILDKFEYDNNRLMAREARQEIESQRVFSALNNASITFTKLKGIVIKNIYPLPHMRTHADVDILMSASDKEAARSIMAQLGYTLKESIDYADEYEKDNFFIYELHSSLTTSTSPYAAIFRNVRNHTTPDNDKINSVITDEYFYLHLLTHMQNHFLSGGCGIRQLFDLYLFRQKHPDLDRNFIDNVLDEYELSLFDLNMRTISEKLFENEELDCEQEAISSFIFRSGEYGSNDLKHISMLSTNKKINWTFLQKVKYFFTLWFPGTKTLKTRYPVLEKAPFLLPVCWVRRILYVLFFKRSAITEQKKEIKRLNSDELKEARRVQKLAGIK